MQRADDEIAFPSISSPEYVDDDYSARTAQYVRTREVKVNPPKMCENVPLPRLTQPDIGLPLSSILLSLATSDPGRGGGPGRPRMCNSYQASNYSFFLTLLFVFKIPTGGKKITFFQLSQQSRDSGQMKKMTQPESVSRSPKMRPTADHHIHVYGWMEHKVQRRPGERRMRVVGGDVTDLVLHPSP